MKPNATFNVKQMKDYIRSNKLNHPDVKLSMKRADMIAGLKKAGHWDESKSKPKSVKDKVKAIEKKATPKPAPKPTPKPAPKPTPKPEPKPAPKSSKEKLEASKKERLRSERGDRPEGAISSEQFKQKLKELGYDITSAQEKKWFNDKDVFIWKYRTIEKSENIVGQPYHYTSKKELEDGKFKINYDTSKFGKRMFGWQWFRTGIGGGGGPVFQKT
tara:strand:- start:1941 stop:2588 length:648 start_codon:yes stop_codon:yes gene_type:complete